MFQILMILIIFYFMICSNHFMDYENIRNDVASTLNISNEKVSEISHDMINFIKNNDKEINSFFSEREKSHLEEIKNILERILLVIIFLSIIFIVILFLIFKRKIICKNIMKKMLLSVSISLTIIIGIVGIAFLNTIDFINIFHLAIFRTDTWILNPVYDKSIYFFPTNLFIDAIILLLVCMTLVNAIIVIALHNFIKNK